MSWLRTDCLLHGLGGVVTWREEAACRGANPEIFFLGYGPGRGHGQLSKTAKARALELCAGCPVADVCLDYALSLPASGDFGIWGGTTEKERIKLRRARRQHQPPRSGRTLQEAASM